MSSSLRVVGLLQHLLEPGQYLLLVSAADESGHVIGHFGVHVVHRVTVYLVDQGRSRVLAASTKRAPRMASRANPAPQAAPTAATPTGWPLC